jgi:hypothetical protein
MVIFFHAQVFALVSTADANELRVRVTGRSEQGAPNPVSRDLKFQVGFVSSSIIKLIERHLCSVNAKSRNTWIGRDSYAITFTPVIDLTKILLFMRV